MIDEREKLESLKDSLEIVKKYDDEKVYEYIDSLLDDDLDDKAVREDTFNEMVHGTITSYTKLSKSKKK